MSEENPSPTSTQPKQADGAQSDLAMSQSQLAGIEPEDVLVAVKPRGQGPLTDSQKRERVSRETYIEFLLGQIGDQFKEKKRHIKEARKIDKTMEKLMTQVQNHIYGYEISSDEPEQM